MAIAHVQTQSNTGANSTSITITNFAAGSGSDRSLVAYIMWGDAVTSGEPSVSSVVFNTTENFTYRGETHWNPFGDNYYNVEIWTLDNPSNSTGDIVATLDQESTSLGLAVSEYSGANNGVGANTGHFTGTGGNPSCTFTTGSSDSLIVACHVAQVADAAPYTEGTGTTKRHENGLYWAGEEAASGGSDTIDITHDTARRASMVAVELQAAGGAPSGQPMSLRATTVPHMRRWHPGLLCSLPLFLCLSSFSIHFNPDHKPEVFGPAIHPSSFHLFALCCRLPATC